MIKLPADVRTWLPDDAVIDAPVYVPETLEPKRYHVRVALLDPRTGLPAVRLGIEGRKPDGWQRARLDQREVAARARMREATGTAASRRSAQAAARRACPSALTGARPRRAPRPAGSGRGLRRSDSR